MNKISFYILREFISFLWYIILAFAIIFVLVDLVENVDSFIDHDVHIRLITLYYVFYLPYIIVLTLPVSMLLATMFSLGRLVGDNEITAMKSSGLSLYRILMPLFIFSFLMGFVIMAFSEGVVPRTNVYREDIKDQGNEYSFTFSINREMDRNHVYLMNDDGRIIYARSYKSRSRTARDVVIFEPLFASLIPRTLADSTMIGIRRRIDADFMVFSNNTWTINNAVVRSFVGGEEAYRAEEVIPAAFITRKPSDFARIEMKPEEMNYLQLKQYIQEVNSKGGDASEWLVDLYMKIAFPFVSFVIVFFGAPMTAGTSSRGKTAAFGIALAISFTYYALINASQVLGRNGAVNPIAAAWTPNLLFLVVGAILMVKAKK